jgi:Co/Zn/Cd efflux system component
MPAVPLFADTCLILAQRVCPKELFDLTHIKLNKIRNSLGDQFYLKELKLWSIDKSYSIANIKVRIEADSDQKAIAQQIEQKLSKKFFKEVHIEIE